MTIPYVDLAAQHRPLRQELLEAVGRVLDHGQFILGPEVKELEERLAERLGARHVIGVSNGTDALILALEAAGVKPGDEVITVSHSFVATASSIVMVGATPVFVEVLDDTMTMDPQAVRRAITPKTRAILPVHLNGTPCDMTQLQELCREHGLAMVEDVAQAIGARWQGQCVGTFGIGAFSLHPLKIFSACGDAGFVTLREGDDEPRLRRARNLGLVDRDHCAEPAGNRRLDTVLAAMLLVKLRHLDAWTAARARHVEAYRSALAGRLRLPTVPEGAAPVHSCFAVRHPERDRIVAALRARGIDAKSHYPLAIHQQEAFAGRPHGPLPVTERVVAEIFSLPTTPELSEAQRDEVIGALRAVT